MQGFNRDTLLVINNKQGDHQVAKHWLHEAGQRIIRCEHTINEIYSLSEPFTPNTLVRAQTAVAEINAVMEVIREAEALHKENNLMSELIRSFCISRNPKVEKALKQYKQIQSWFA